MIRSTITSVKHSDRRCPPALQGLGGQVMVGAERLDDVGEGWPLAEDGRLGVEGDLVHEIHELVCAHAEAVRALAYRGHLFQEDAVRTHLQTLAVHDLGVVKVRRAEIDEAATTISVYEQIVRVDVAVRESARVHVGESPGEIQRKLIQEPVVHVEERGRPIVAAAQHPNGVPRLHGQRAPRDALHHQRKLLLPVVLGERSELRQSQAALDGDRRKQLVVGVAVGAFAVERQVLEHKIAGDSVDEARQDAVLPRGGASVLLVAQHLRLGLHLAERHHHILQLLLEIVVVCAPVARVPREREPAEALRRLELQRQLLDAANRRAEHLELRQRRERRNRQALELVARRLQLAQLRHIPYALRDAPKLVVAQEERAHPGEVPNALRQLAQQVSLEAQQHEVLHLADGVREPSELVAGEVELLEEAEARPEVLRQAREVVAAEVEDLEVVRLGLERRHEPLGERLQAQIREVHVHVAVVLGEVMLGIIQSQPDLLRRHYCAVRDDDEGRSGEHSDPHLRL
mmetsp:Transcript_45056/g.141115  ORF Transcript_45056/g.141115 Transcript_45056/m.141115 type:complete len:516 (+) Transcript_45056:450-1997(+)